MNNERSLSEEITEGFKALEAIRNNEPVAWMEKFKGGTIYYGYKNPRSIPLYTHPVKELTDEEIANTWDDVRKDATLKSSMKDIQDFARAILKRAQEK